MLLIEVEDGQEGGYLDDLTDTELRAMYLESVEDYEDSVTDIDDPQWQQACADAVLMMSGEAKKRGILPGWVH